MRLLSRRVRSCCLFAVVLLASTGASATPFSNVFVFGDSLSDSGNVAAVAGGAFQPVPFGGLIPALAYESGRFSNGPVWAESFAAGLGLSAAPALLGGTNFAFGGARVGSLPVAPPPPGVPPTLFQQAAGFLGGIGFVAPSDALYVVWGGGNDARDAAVLKEGGDDAGASAVVQAAAGNIAGIVAFLANFGATQFLVPNVPNLGLTPEALRGSPGLAAASTAVSVEFNATLEAALAPLQGIPSLDLRTLDVFQTVTDVVANPAAFGLLNASDPCVDLATVCANPDEFLFYDGIHPTAAGHLILAASALQAVPEPATWLLAAVGLLAARRARRRF